MTIARYRTQFPSPPSSMPDTGIDVEPFDPLASDAGDQIEVLVEVEDEQGSQLRRRGDEYVRYRRSSVVTAIGQEP